MKIKDLIGKNATFHVGADAVLANIEDMNSNGYLCKVIASNNRWYEEGETYYISLNTFVLHVNKNILKKLGTFKVKHFSNNLVSDCTVYMDENKKTYTTYNVDEWKEVFERSDLAGNYDFEG